jgi:hypothetical protein
MTQTTINKQSLILWIISTCLIFSTLFNVLFVYTIQQLRKPYNEQIMLNEQKRKEIQLTIDYRHEVQIEYMRSLIGRQFIDSIGCKLEQEYDILQNSNSEQLVQRYFNNDQTLLGGNYDNNEKN